MYSSLCIFGAGAIGLDLAIQAILAGINVTLIARGHTLEVLKTRGIVQRSPEREIAPNRFRVYSSLSDAGQQPLIVLTTKVEDLLEVSRAPGRARGRPCPA